MSIAYSHLQAAERIVSAYPGKLPFPDHAREYFRAHKQHGSRDRRSILSLCYAGFRMGASLPGVSFTERVIAGRFLQQTEPDGWLEAVAPSWNALLPLDLEARLHIVRHKHPEFEPLHIFPWTDALGAGIDPRAFALSHLQQPSLFIRLRPGREAAVMSLLQTQVLPFHRVGEHALRLASGTDLGNLFEPDKDIVIQDLSSQRVAEMMRTSEASIKRAWDCCAGSGGKSLLLHDLFPQAQLAASDLRPSILQNLKLRFQKAGIRNANVFVADLEQASVGGQGKFDFVMADVPCTGSGTWGRNPEWLVHFDPAQIKTYAQRQLRIAQHASTSLTRGGQFLYVACSVFKQENEQVVDALSSSTKLQLQEMKYFEGFGEGADTMFAARFISPA